MAVTRPFIYINRHDIVSAPLDSIPLPFHRLFFTPLPSLSKWPCKKRTKFQYLKRLTHQHPLAAPVINDSLLLCWTARNKAGMFALLPNMGARPSERLHGPRIREQYITGWTLHCMSHFLDALLYLSQSRSCLQRRSRVIYPGIWRRSFLRGLWARCTVCAYITLLLPFPHIHGPDRIHLRRSY
jgi:hypothetical protein